jgi:hypothetical protein
MAGRSKISAWHLHGKMQVRKRVKSEGQGYRAVYDGSFFEMIQ